MSPALAKRQAGKATFHFRDLDATMAAEVEALLARAYDIYMTEDDEADAAKPDDSRGADAAKPDAEADTPAS